MKFDQTMAFAILSILYATTIFGSEDTTLFYVDKDVCSIIEKYLGDNDGWYEQAGHVKPYSLPLDLMEKHLPKVYTTLALAGLRVACSTLPDEAVLPLFLLSPEMGLVARKINRATQRLVNSRLRTKCPINISIWDDFGTISILGQIGNGDYTSEIRSLSDMKFKEISQSSFYPACELVLKKRIEENGLIYELKNRKINIYLSDGDCQLGCKFRSLSTPGNVTAFGVSSSNGKTIATLGEKGVHTLKFQRRKNLYEVMKPTDMNTD